MPDFLTPSAARTSSALVGCPLRCDRKNCRTEGKTRFKARAVSAALESGRSQQANLCHLSRLLSEAQANRTGDTRSSKRASIPQTECLFISRATRGQPWNFTLGAIVLSKRITAMSERDTNNTGSRQSIRGVQVFVALGLIVCIVLIIAGGWLMKSENRDTSATAHLRTAPKTSSTTGSR